MVRAVLCLLCLVASVCLSGCDDEYCCDSNGNVTGYPDYEGQIAAELTPLLTDGGINFDGGLATPPPLCPAGSTEQFDCWPSYADSPGPQDYWSLCGHSGELTAAVRDDGAQTDVAVDVDVRDTGNPQVSVAVYDGNFNVIASLVQASMPPLQRITTRLARGKKVRYVLWDSHHQCRNWVSVTAPGGQK